MSLAHRTALLAKSRLTKEYKLIHADPIDGCVIRPDPKNIFTWHFVIDGISGTPMCQVREEDVVVTAAAAVSDTNGTSNTSNASNTSDEKKKDAVESPEGNGGGNDGQTTVAAPDNANNTTTTTTTTITTTTKTKVSYPAKYYGTIEFPQDYPMAPPSVYIHTPNGMIKPSESICMSMTSWHPETWHQSWGPRTVVLGLFVFLEDVYNKREFSATMIHGFSDADVKRHALQSKQFNINNVNFIKMFPELVTQWAAIGQD